MAAKSLFLLLCSSEHEKIQMAAMLSSVAAVSERPVQLLVSMSAILAFKNGLADSQRYRGGEFSRSMLEKKVPDAMTLFHQGRLLGGLQVYACSMAMDVAQLSISDLVVDLFDGERGLTAFLSDAEQGELVVL